MSRRLPMASKVWFIDAAAEGMRLAGKLGDLFDAAGLPGCIARGDMVALKMHLGERGAVGTIHPMFVRIVADKVREAGGEPFLTDANTLYRGHRKNAPEHLATAHMNGYSYESVGAPLIIGDGLRGESAVEVSVRGGKHLAKVKLAAEIYRADAVVVMTHVTGHCLFGLGGAIKNLGMGCGSRAGKQMMHSTVKPKVDRAKCAGDFKCAEHCPSGAIRNSGGKAEISQEKCIGCGECTVRCPAEAIAIRWGEAAGCQSRTAEFCAGMMQGRAEKFGFLSFAVRVTEECDCMTSSGVPFVPDIGVLASRDLVAIDQAAADLVNGSHLILKKGAKGAKGAKVAKGSDNIRAATGADWRMQIDAAEALGLGKKEYELAGL